MRKALLSVMVSMLAFVAHAVTYMQVKTTEDQVVLYDVDKVEQVDYVDVEQWDFEKNEMGSIKCMRTNTTDGKEDKYEVEKVVEVDYVESPASDVVDGYEYVDLGLPSGLLWAKMNVGATQPEDYGGHYAWGEVMPKENYYTTTYAHAGCSSFSDLESKGVVSKEDVLSPNYDAATYNWGSKWRTPRWEEFQELIDNCIFTRIKLNGTVGCKVESRYNHNWIFLPSAGYMRGTYRDRGHYKDDRIYDWGYYMASNVRYKSDWEWYSVLGFFPQSIETKLGGFEAYYGNSVRPVTGEYKKPRKRYSVNFYDSDNTLVESQLVFEGDDAQCPEMPELEGYEFLGWSMSSEKVRSDIDLYALYRKTEVVEIGGHEYIDLGLPSGLKWATMNVGANNPEEYGDYIAWGEVSAKEKYTEENSLTYGKDTETLASEGIINPNGILNPPYDAATQNWGDDWRMPTKEDWEELRDHCVWSHITLKGVNGYKVASKRNGNNCWIFLPFPGFYSNYNVLSEDYVGFYWSSSVYNNDNASYLYIQYLDNSIIIGSYKDLSDGLSIRPVSGSK